MDSHTRGRAMDAWRERNAGAEAPGDGQHVARYVDPLPTVDQPENVGAPVTDSHVKTELVAEVDPTVDWPRVTGSAEPAALVDPGELAGTSMTTDVETVSQTIEAEPTLQTGLSTESAPGLVGRGRGRPRKT